MKKAFIIITTVFVFGLLHTVAQAPRQIIDPYQQSAENLDGFTNRMGNRDSTMQQTTVITTVPTEVRNWKMTGLFTRADSIPVDTVSDGFQVHSPAYRQAVANVQLGNVGSPWKAAMVSETPIHTRFLFTESLRNFFATPESWKYYNTRTPYTNLYYQNAPPKSRSEEVVGVLFTQNINSVWNAGVDYQVISSIGKYAFQTANNRHFRLFSSYSGEKYEMQTSFVFNRVKQHENGGLQSDSSILYPPEGTIGRTENLDIIFDNGSATNHIDNYQLFVNNSLKIGNVTVSSRDSVKTQMPLGTAFHTLHIDRMKRMLSINGFPAYQSPNNYYLYNAFNKDSVNTRDSVSYTSIHNIFQLKFNEEANSLLRFGLRGFIGNQIEMFYYPSPSDYYRRDSVVHRFADTTLVTTYVGGQIFKNIGENFKWNAGAKFYFQGYRAGDSEITGALDTRFRIRKDTAGVFANGGMFLASPDFFTQRYFSNHFVWDNDFRAVKTLKVCGGITIPTRKLELTGEVRLINDFIYFDSEAMPAQTPEVLTVMELKLYKHFQVWHFHSRNTLLYQLTSNQEVFPLPMFSGYSSNYLQGVYSKVLFFQIGIDLRYNTEWHAPAYMVPTGQFYIQRERTVGNYLFADAFINLQLKRARLFFKMSHVNQGLWGNNYFHTIGYPANPRSFRMGVSWNFYD
ncbi:MAG: putative porin [Cytophagaceae bacterium]|jgi:hypothetical protein|nr:putative porin [Cytophagaceae bacterium]